MATGIVYRSTGSWYYIKDTNDKVWNGRIKGVIKLDDITSTNPIAVGDLVDFEIESETENSVTISAIHDRKNYITRQSPRAKQHQHIVAANIDQALLVATIRDPRTSQGFIDRFLVASEMYGVPAILLFNKLDIYKKKDFDKLQHFKDIYERLGYTVIGISIKENKGVDEVQSLMHNKITLVSGHSGVGKSSFINLILPGSKIKTQDVSGWSGKGLHTTTFAEMFDLPTGGKIIDTPGMREFAITGLDKQELSGYFREMRAKLSECQFNNCLHINEPGCAVKEAVVNGEIDEDRYVSYYNILESLNENKYR